MTILALCPHCGETDPACFSILELEPGAYATGCQQCGSHGPVEETEELAVEGWNRRFEVNGSVVVPRVQG